MLNVVISGKGLNCFREIMEMKSLSENGQWSLQVECECRIKSGAVTIAAAEAEFKLALNSRPLHICCMFVLHNLSGPGCLRTCLP